MNKEFICFRVGDLVSRAAHRHGDPQGLWPGLVVSILKEGSWKYEYCTDWPLLDGSEECFRGERARVLHPSGRLTLWRFEELTRLAHG